MRLRLSQAALTIALILLFLAANRGAYEGYFSDDDLDNLANTMLAGFDTFWKGFLSLRYDSYNFRPVGHLAYRWLGQRYGLDFTPYVLSVQLVHLLNTYLLYRLTRRISGERAGILASVFFCFHPALLAAHWKPMYLFDALCGTLLISAYILHRKRSLANSVLLFWSAYKAKEVAIFFPLLLLFRPSQGHRQWLYLTPFLCISSLFGIQALLANHGREASSYSLTFTPAALWLCLEFYSRSAFGLPWLLLPAWWWAAPSDRQWILWSMISSLVLLAPLLFLPGRLYSVYLYVPLLFGSIAVGILIGGLRLPLIGVAVIVYFGFGLHELRRFRRAELTQARATREFVAASCETLRDQRGLSSVWYEGAPRGLNSWGVEAALRLCNKNLQLELRPWDVARIKPGDKVLQWTKLPGASGRTTIVRFRGELSGDWFAWEESFRWMGSHASAKLVASQGHRHILLDLAAAPAQEVELILEGRSLGVQRLSRHDAQKLTFSASHLRPGESTLELRVRPTRTIGTDPRDLGLAVRSIETVP